MVRRLMRLGGAISVLLGLLLVPMPAAAADVSPAAEEGFQQISQCLQSHDDLAVLLVVDESQSLQQTDPDDKRARLLANLVRALGRQAGQDTATGQRGIDLAISTFSTDYRPLVPWTEITPDSSERIATALESQIPALDQGGGTNHVAALRGVRNQMAEISATQTNGLPPCTLTVLFTDGVLDVSDSDAEDAAAAAEMCRPRGVVDGVRRDGINLVTVMLFDREVADQAPEAYRQGRDLLKATAEGQAGQRDCGTVPIPQRYARGAYLEGEVDRLATLFATAFALSNGATQLQKDGSPVTFTIDPGIASFAVIGSAPQGIQLKGPDGQIIDIAAGASGKDEVRSYWDFDTVTVEKTVVAEDLGEWTVIRPGQTDPVSLFLNSGLGIKLDEAQIIAGQPAQISGQIVRVGKGEPVDLSVYQSAELTAAPVGAAPKPLTLNDDGTFSGTLALDSKATVAQIDLALALRTKSGQALTPVAGRFTLDITLPKEFPQVTPALLALSPLVGKNGTAQGSFTATGSSEGPTKVCVGTTKWEADDPAIYSTDLATGCFDLAVGEKREIAVEVTTSTPTDERVTGTIPVELTSSTGAVQGVDIAATFAATRPLNQAVRVGVVALLAALALLLPALILFAFNRHLAKFRPPDGIRSVVEPVVVSKAGVRPRQPASTADDGSSNSVLFELPAEKLRVMALPERDARVLPGADGSELRTHVPRSLFGSPTAEVRAGEGLRVVSNRAPFIHNRGHSAPVSFGLGDVWYATVSDADLVGKSFDEGVPALVTAYVPPRGQGDSIQDVSAKIRNFPHWETVIGQLRSFALNDSGKAAAAGMAADADLKATPGHRPGGPTDGRSGRPGGPSTRPSGPSARPTGPDGSGSRPAGPSGPTTRPSGPSAPTSRPSGPSASPPSGPPRPDTPPPTTQRPSGPTDGAPRRPGGPS